VLFSALGLLFAASSAPALWLVVEVPPDGPCQLDVLAAAIRGLRPDVVLQVGKRTKDSDLEAQFVERGKVLSLTVRGRGKPLSRELPPPGVTCGEATQTAALMIDRYLAQFYGSGEEARIGEMSPGLLPSLAVELGLSLVQAVSGVSPNPSPGLVLALDLRLGLLLLALGVEVNLRGSEAIGGGVQGTYRVQPAATWLGAGVAPRLGPGRLEALATLGLSLLWVDVEASLHQEHAGRALDPYVGLAAAYALDLPAHFSVSLRFEERFVPSPSSFAIEGLPGAAAISMRRFTADLGLLAGYTFF
jgi:hypothetical protein